MHRSCRSDLLNRHTISTAARAREWVSNPIHQSQCRQRRQAQTAANGERPRWRRLNSWLAIAAFSRSSIAVRSCPPAEGWSSDSGRTPRRRCGRVSGGRGAGRSRRFRPRRLRGSGTRSAPPRIRTGACETVPRPTAKPRRRVGHSGSGQTILRQTAILVRILLVT